MTCIVLSDLRMNGISFRLFALMQCMLILKRLTLNVLITKCGKTRQNVSKYITIKDAYPLYGDL